MNSALQLNISSVSHSTMIPGQQNISGDTGGSLFQDLLTKINGASEEQTWMASLAGNEEDLTDISGESDETDTLSDLIQGLEKKLRKAGHKSSRLVLSDSAIPQLISLLESQGFSTEKINQMILSSRNKDGLLQVDKLLAQLSQIGDGSITGKDSPAIDMANIPQTGEVLVKMGLETEDVKKVIEESVNQKGEISITELSAALKKYVSNPASESELISLLEQNGIKVKSPIIDTENMDQDLKKQLLSLVENPSQDIQKTIKQDIAALLREKGIPPEEVKSFLENIKVEISRSNIKDEASNRSEINSLLNQVSLKDESAWQKGSWNEKILGVLQNERLLISNDSGKSSLQEQGELRLNLSELLKQGDQKTKTEFLLNVSESKISSEYPKTETLAQNNNRGFLSENIMGNDLLLHNTAKESNEVGSLNQARGVYNLPQPLPSVVDRMIWMIRAGEQRGRIMVNPPELGRIDLDLAIKNGHLHANLSAESIVVKEIIEANLNQLKQQLTDQGLTVDKFEVMVGLNDKDSERENMWAGHNRKGFSSKKGSNTVKQVIQDNDDRPVGKSLINRYQIDMQV